MNKILIKMFFILFIIINCIFYTISFADVDNNVLQLNGTKTIAWKQVDNARIYLANGQDISGISTSRKTDIKETIEEELVEETMPIDLCLVLDVSGSMKGGNKVSKIQKLREATIEMVKGISNVVGENNLRVAIFSYSGDVKKITDFIDIDYNTISTVKSHLDNLNAGGGTATDKAVDEAKKYWSSGVGKENTKKITLLVTDGVPNSTGKTKKSIESFKEKHGDNIKFISFMIGKTSIPGCFNPSDACFTATTDVIQSIMTGDIKTYILTGANSEIDVGDYIVQKEGFFEVGNDYMAILENELSHGATMVVEYSIHIKTTENLEKIEIIDHMPEGMQCLNTSSGGYFLSGTNDIQFKIPQNELQNLENGEFILKLTMSKLLTGGDLVTELENTADLEVYTKDGQVYKTKSEETDNLSNDGDNGGEEDEEDDGLHSPKLTIIPPFGKEKNKYYNLFTENHEKFLILICVGILGAIFIKINMNRIRKQK